MRRVSITWHNNKDKKHITTIIKNHNKTHPLLWPWKNQLRIHPSKNSRKLREPVWRPKRLIMPRKIPKNTFKIVSFFRFRKVLVRPNRTSYAKVTAKQCSTPETRSQQRKTSVSCSPVDQTITYKLYRRTSLFYYIRS